VTGPLSPGRGGVQLAVHAQPGARRDELSGLHDGRLKVRVRAPPEAGRATAAILDLLADAFRLRRADVVLISGQDSRKKLVFLAGLALPDAEARLIEALKSAGKPAED
jgi:uncharacterized protein (TIGR00251 family)